jgi:hypothetical protein
MDVTVQNEREREKKRREESHESRVAFDFPNYFGDLT